MMRRGMLAFGLMVAVIGAAFVGAELSSRSADAKPKVEAKPMPQMRAGFVAMSEVMAGFKKWKDQAAKANLARQQAFQKINEKRVAIAEMQQKAPLAKGEEQEKLTKKIVQVSREVEDMDRTTQAEINKLAHDALIELQRDFAREVEMIVRERQLDVVFAHPANFEKIFAETNNSQASLQMYFQAPAVSPIYLRAELDLTKELIDRLNARHAQAEKAEQKNDD